MSSGLELYPSGAGMLLAAAAVVVGAPLFSDGLRALRLRRHFAALRQTPLADRPSGFASVHGTVVLESPMFAPLSGSPCAGYRLEMLAFGHPVARALEERRPFRLIDGGRSARVLEAGGRWDLGITAERDVEAKETLTERLSALIARVPEASMARRSGRSIRLIERALAAGRECYVVGFAREARRYEAANDMELARTGTDDALGASYGTSSPQAPGPDVDLLIGVGEHLDFMLVSDQPPSARQLRMPIWRSLGIALGPALTLAGLIYLASALDAWRALAR